MQASLDIFAKNILALRRKKGLEQIDVAEALNTQEDRVRKWEAGACFPKMSMIIRLVDFLGYKDLYRLLTEDITGLKK